jgi:flagellar biosynthesis chaperone FliJ
MSLKKHQRSEAVNKDRRKEIDKAIVALESIKGAMDEAKSLVESCASEEREYYDNMNENLQQGDKGSQADNAATQLEEVSSSLEEFDIDDLIGKLSDAKE